MAVVLLATLVWSFIADHVTGLAMGIAPNIAADDFMQVFGAFRLRRRIESAVQAAYEQFAGDLKRRDPDLLAALERANFSSNKSVGAILGQAAMNPQELDTQAKHLAEVMRQAAPTATETQQAAAARALIQAVHQRISLIQELREGLILLETLRVRKRVEQPPYAPGLMEGILRSANQAALDLRHGYVSTGHLLNAIMAEPRSVAAWILATLDVTERNVYASLRVVVKPKVGLPPGTLSDGARKALKIAPELAAEHGALLTGTEHVLLALAQAAIQDGADGQTIKGIFAWLKIDPQAVYDTAMQVARGQSAVQSAIFSFSGDTPPSGDPHVDPNAISPDARTAMNSLTTLGR